MTPLTIIIIAAAVMAGIGVLAIALWLFYTSWLNQRARRLAARKGFYRGMVAEMATRDRALLDPVLHQHRTIADLEALEAVLEEQARGTADRPAWLLDAYDRLGLVDKYVAMLDTARQWRERAFAAELLGRVGNAKAVPALLETIRATRVEDADVREIALRALARIGDPRAVEPLIEALKSADTWLAPRIADILTRHGDLVVGPMTAFLDEPIRHPARAWAANVLGEVRAQRAFPALVRSLGDFEDEVRGKSATALGRLSDRRAIGYLLEQLLTDPAPFVRARIARALGQFDDPQVIERLVRALGDPAWWVRMRSIEALEQIGARAEGPLLVALDDPDAEIRTRAAVALERLGAPARLAGMIERGERVEDALAMLVKFATAGAREVLAELLLHPSADVRRAVLTAVGRVNRRDLPTELLQVARNDAAPELRALALDLVRHLGMAEAIPIAVEGIHHASPDVRAAAALALGTLQVISETPALVDLLGDGEESVRVAAARALSFLGDTGSTQALVRSMAGATPAFRTAIADALARLDVDVLTTLADAADTETRIAVIEAVAQRGGAPAHEPVALGLRDPDDDVRAAAADACARLGLDSQGSTLIRMINDDPSPLARERAALAIGILRISGGETALLAACHRAEPPEVRAAAALAIGAFEQDSIVTRVLEMADETAVREQLRDRLKHDPQFRLLSRKLPASRHLELRAIGAGTPEQAEQSLAEGMRSTLDAGERIRLINGLRAFQGVDSRDALRQALRADPSPEVRTAALVALGGLLDAEELLDVGSRTLTDPSLLVRRAAVGFFAKIAPDRALPALLEHLRPDDDPAVLAAAAELAEGAFPTFAELVQRLPVDGDDAVLVLRIARYIHYPDAGAIVARFARSEAPLVRESLAGLWRHRSDLVDAAAIDLLALDPVVPVRQTIATAAGAAGRFPLLERMLEDPDPSVRRAVALALARVHLPPRHVLGLLDRLVDDPDPPVRAAAYVGHLLQGLPVPLPPGLDPDAAAAAVRDAADLGVLRETARTAPAEDRRLAAALALALLGDQVARDVARTDPVPTIRHRVSGTLELIQ